MKAKWMGLFAAAQLAIALTACAQAPQTAERQATQARMTDGKALFNERCATVAGEKIYRKVENVEGLLLMKVRPDRGDAELANRDWPGAAFARESSGKGYIDTFLGWEYASNAAGRDDPITPTNRGYIANPGGSRGMPGYRWVEVVDQRDGQRYRYTGSTKIVGRKDTTARGVQIAMEKDPNYDLNIYRWSLDKAPSPSPTPPRYGVTYEDHVIPEERYLGVASSTVKVLDLQTKEVLGEMIRYAWSPGAPSRVNPSPWLTAYKCPGHPVGADAATRKFVDQILIPAKEK
jgi:hypothetical protein